MQSSRKVRFLELKALRLARRAPGADYPAYGARQQSASPYIEEFAGCAPGKLLKGKINGRIGAALDQLTPLVHYWDGYAVEVVSSYTYSAFSLQAFLFKEFVGPESDKFLIL